MKYAVYFFATTFFLLFLASCQKDDEQNGVGMPLCEVPPPPPCEQSTPFIPFQDSCVEFFRDPYSIEWSPLKTRSRFFLPVVNPNSPDELLYIFRDSLLILGLKLYKVDFCNNQKSLVTADFSHMNFGGAIWGATDWIVFTSFPDEQLWKMKSNGDSLQQLTDLPRRVTYPIWINEGLNILAITKLDGDPYTRRYLFSPEGEILDTINTIFHPINNYWNGKIAATWSVNGERTIGYYDITEDELYAAPGTILEHTPNGITWIDENNIAWMDHIIGLSRVNLQTGEVTLLKEICDNQEVDFVTSSPLTNGIIYMAERQREVIDSFTLDTKTRIYKLDAFTGEQWLVDLE